MQKNKLLCHILTDFGIGSLVNIIHAYIGHYFLPIAYVIFILTQRLVPVKKPPNISLMFKILHLRQDSFTRKVRTIFTLKIIVSIFVKLFLILVLHFVKILSKRATESWDNPRIISQDKYQF